MRLNDREISAFKNIYGPDAVQLNIGTVKWVIIFYGDDFYVGYILKEYPTILYQNY